MSLMAAILIALPPRLGRSRHSQGLSDLGLQDVDVSGSDETPTSSCTSPASIVQQIGHNFQYGTVEHQCWKTIIEPSTASTGAVMRPASEGMYCRYKHNMPATAEQLAKIVLEEFTLWWIAAKEHGAQWRLWAGHHKLL